MEKYLGRLLQCVIILLFISSCNEAAPPDANRLSKPSSGDLPVNVSVTTSPTSTYIPTATATMSSTETPTPTPEILTAVAQLFSTETPPATATRVTTIAVNGRIIPLVSGHPQPYLSHFRLVTFYGHPASPELGILGEIPLEQLAASIRETAVSYQKSAWSAYEIKPAIHFISSVASTEQGSDGLYRKQTPIETLTQWVHFAQEENLAFIIDIQPGQADLMEEFERIRPLLYSPHVHLAIDPEFMMRESDIPGQKLGHIDGEHINQLQAQLNEIALDIGVNKVLIVHQFEPAMIQNKTAIQDYPYTELIIDADGFGAPETKLADYQQYTFEPGWEYGGLKLFHQWDDPMLTPDQILQISPPPALVIYQ